MTKLDVGLASDVAPLDFQRSFFVYRRPQTILRKKNENSAQAGKTEAKMNNEITTVVIVDDEPIVRMDLKEMLESKGYSVVAEARDGFDAIAECKKHNPEIVFMDIKMPMMDGLSAARVIHEEGLAQTIIVLTAYSGKEYVDNAVESGVSGYLVKPISENLLVPTIELAVSRSREIKSLKKELEKVSQRLDSRIILDQAKGWLMQSQNLSESEAYGVIRKISQDKNISMRQVAEYILYSKNKV